MIMMFSQPITVTGAKPNQPTTQEILQCASMCANTRRCTLYSFSLIIRWDGQPPRSERDQIQDRQLYVLSEALGLPSPTFKLRAVIISMIRNTPRDLLIGIHRYIIIIMRMAQWFKRSSCYFNLWCRFHPQFKKNCVSFLVCL